MSTAIECHGTCCGEIHIPAELFEKLPPDEKKTVHDGAQCGLFGCCCCLCTACLSWSPFMLCYKRKLVDISAKYNNNNAGVGGDAPNPQEMKRSVLQNLQRSSFRHKSGFGYEPPAAGTAV